MLIKKVIFLARGKDLFNITEFGELLKISEEGRLNEKQIKRINQAYKSLLDKKKPISKNSKRKFWTW